MDPDETDKHLLFIPWHDYPNAPSCNVTETNMESSEFVANNDEHAKRFPGVFNLGQEIRGKTEGECNLGWLIEISFEDVLIED